MNAMIVSFDDWQALYVDRKKVDEGHRLQLRDVFKHLNVDCVERYLEYEDFDTEANGIPDHLDEYPVGTFS